MIKADTGKTNLLPSSVLKQFLQIWPTSCRVCEKEIASIGAKVIEANVRMDRTSEEVSLPHTGRGPHRMRSVRILVNLWKQLRWSISLASIIELLILGD